MATRWRPQISMPLLLVRGMDTYVELEVWGPTGIQEPTSGTISLYDGKGTAIVSTQALSVSSTTRRVYTTILAASLPATLDYSDTWRASWALSLAGESATFHQDAQLIARPWYPSLTLNQLTAASPKLRTIYDLDDPEDAQELDDVLQNAIEDTQLRLVGSGRRPWLIFDAWRINAYLTETVLGRIYRSLLLDGDPANFTAHDRLATKHEEAAELAWGAMNFKYDEEQTGKGDDATRAKGPPTVRLGITR